MFGARGGFFLYFVVFTEILLNIKGFFPCESRVAKRRPILFSFQQLDFLFLE